MIACSHLGVVDGIENSPSGAYAWHKSGEDEENLKPPDDELAVASISASIPVSVQDISNTVPLHLLEVSHEGVHIFTRNGLSTVTGEFGGFKEHPQAGPELWKLPGEGTVSNQPGNALQCS